MKSIRCVAALLSALLIVSPVANAATPQISSSSQQPQPPSTGPIPAQIATAHTIFLTNSVADPNFPIDTTRAYNDIYALLKTWGHYQLVNSPAQADLVFQLRDIAPITSVDGFHGDVSSYTSPAFQLNILDPHTNLAIWTVTSPVYLDYSKKKIDQWIALMETNLISRIKVLNGLSLTATETTDLTTFPPTHTKRHLLIFGGVVAAVAAGGAIATVLTLRHMKNSQDSFCTANNIPLSECAGG